MTARAYPSRLFGAPVLISAALLFSSLALAQLQGTVGSYATHQGISVALSADGSTVIVSGWADNAYIGAAWVYVRSDGAWTQQGSKLVGSDAVGPAYQGRSVALSSDGNTAIVGGPDDNQGTGAAWVFTRIDGVWTQQGNKLIGSGAVGAAYQGQSVALSADGNTALVGGFGDNSFAGAAWIYTRSSDVWSQQGGKLVGTLAVDAEQGSSVALSSDGNTAIVGGRGDNNSSGAAWVFTRNGSIWTQQGNKLVGTGSVGSAAQGDAVALSADGDTAIVGGWADNSYIGAAWLYTRSDGEWTQQGRKLVGTGAVGAAYQRQYVALSADDNTALAGGFGDNSFAGAAWVFVQPGLQVDPTTNVFAIDNPGAPFAPSSFQYQLSATVGSIISGFPNWATSSSTSGTVSAGTDVTFTVNSNARTVMLPVSPPALQVTPTTDIVATGRRGGPFSPQSFHYKLSATYGGVKYSITAPGWLTSSPTSGTVTKSAKTIIFEINSGARSLQPNTYVSSIDFNNATNDKGNTSRLATLTVNPKQFKITVEASPKADGRVVGGGTFAEGTSQTVTATPNAGRTFVHWTDKRKVVSTAESYTFTVAGNATLIADFQ
jgi:hypothetical protein